MSEIFRIKGFYFPIVQEISSFCRKKNEYGFLVEPFLYITSLFILSLLELDLFLVGSIPLVVGDAFAGLIGYRVGKHSIPYNKSKTIEGSVAFFLSSFLAYLIFFNPLNSLILSLFATFVEGLLKRFENILLPFLCVFFYLLIVV